MAMMASDRIDAVTHPEPKSLTGLRDRAATNPDEAVRWAAAQAQAAGRDRKTLGWLLDRAVNDRDPAVQKVALRAVAEGWRDDPRTPVWLRHRAVNDSHSWARELAVH
jgi:hypothetical protein